MEQRGDPYEDPNAEPWEEVDFLRRLRGDPGKIKTEVVRCQCRPDKYDKTCHKALHGHLANRPKYEWFCRNGKRSLERVDL